MTQEQREYTCETCRHYLGGGNCNLSMEMECRDGGFEGWEEDNTAKLAFEEIRRQAQRRVEEVSNALEHIKIAVFCSECAKRGLDNCPMEFYWDSHPADDKAFCSFGILKEPCKDYCEIGGGECGKAD